MSETFKKTAWNILVGTAIVAGGIWALFHLPIIPYPKMENALAAA